MSTVYDNWTADVEFVFSMLFVCPQCMATVLPTLYSYWVGCLTVRSVWHLYCRRCIRIESVVGLSTVYVTCTADVVFVLSRLFVCPQCMALVLYCRRCILIESDVCLSTVYGTCTADVVFVLCRLFVCPQCMALVLPTLYSYWVGCLSVHSVWHLYCRRCIRIESVVCLSTVYDNCTADVVFVLSRVFVYQPCMTTVPPTLYAYRVGCLCINSVWQLYRRLCVRMESVVCVSTVYGNCTAGVLLEASMLSDCPWCMTTVPPMLYSHIFGCLSVHSVWQLYRRRCIFDRLFQHDWWAQLVQSKAVCHRRAARPEGRRRSDPYRRHQLRTCSYSAFPFGDILHKPRNRREHLGHAVPGRRNERGRRPSGTS